MSADDSQTSRRMFLTVTIGGVSGALLAACDSPPPSTDAGPRATDAGPLTTDAGPPAVDAGPRDCSETSVEIGNRHPPNFRHALVLPMADIVAGTERSYDITGESPHPHTLVITAAHFTALQNGEVVEIASSEDMGFDLHDHLVTITCTGMA